MMPADLRAKVSARVLKEAEKQLETLKSEVEELKRKDRERCGHTPSFCVVAVPSR